MKSDEGFFLLTRYLILLVIGLFFSAIYLVFTPLTVQTVFSFLQSLYDSILLPGNVIFVKQQYAKIVPACVAGAAYYLLLILNLTTPMPVRKRITNLIFILGLFFILNVLRIVVFVSLWTQGYQYFDLAHELTWYFGSTVLVVLIWFAGVLVFRIRSIPMYTDFRRLLDEVTGKQGHIPHSYHVHHHSY